MRLPGSDTPARKRWIRLGILAAVVAAFLVIRQLIPDIDLEVVLKDVAQGLGAWTYALVGAMAFLETGAFVGLVAPGEFTVVLGGAVAGQGEIDLFLVLAVAWFCAWAGDTTSFFIGRRLGRGFILEHGPRVRISNERFRQVERYFKNHGGKTIFVGRFIGLVRAFAPFIAGSSGMRYRAFVPYSILGTGLWCATFTLLGYFFSKSLDTVAKYVGRGTFAFGVVVGLIVGVVLAVRYLREHENRERVVAYMERHAVLRPLVMVGRPVWRWIRPEVRFVWHRITPGPLGLEFTTLVSALAVGLFVLIAYILILSDNPGPTHGDVTAMNVVGDVETGWLTSVAKVVTHLGDTYVVVPIIVLAGIWLGVKRRWPELAVLVVGAAIILVGVQVIKAALDRPRPEGGLTQARGAAFPSGHAAYATLWIWLAVTLSVRFRPWLTARGPIVLAGIAVAAAVGLSRVYLRVHWLSDVNGGWALGLSVFAGCAAVAVLIIHLRDNARRRNARSGADQA